MLNVVKDFLKNMVQSRIFVFSVVIILMFSVLIAKLFSLQIVKGNDYQENYRLRIQKTRTLNSARGNIYDRDGNLLAYNELAYNLTIEDNGNYASTTEKNEKLNQLIYEIIQVLDKNGDSINNDFNIILNEYQKYEYSVSGTSLQRFLADIFGYKSVTDDKFLVYNDKLGFVPCEATAEQVVQYLCREKGYNLSEEIYKRSDLYRILVVRYAMSQNSYQKYITTSIALDVSDETMAYINENLHELQGIAIEESTSRKYVDSKYFSHITGYTGKISQKEYDEIFSEISDDYTLNDVVGKSGIEQVMDEYLQGTKGSETIFVDNVGRVLETKERIEPTVGNDVYLSISKDLQEACFDLLEQEIAGIVLSKIENVKTSESAGNAANVIIPIYDVYYALINNNVIKINHFQSDDASATEKAVYQAYQTKLSAVTEELRAHLQSSNAPAYEDLSDEQKVYMSYIVSYLSEQNVLMTDSIDTSDEVYQKWKNDSISLAQYLNHAIAQSWIDITRFSVDEKYSDSMEIYDELVEYILDSLQNNRSFAKKMYKYLIQDDQVTGLQLCYILFDQNVLEYDEDAIAKLKNGTESAFSFLKEKIKNLEITPAQLALDPCSGSCVITDIKTGEILACVTYPGFDNNRLANTVDSEYFQMLNEDLSLPQYNYATQQTTAPGSTFKMLTAAAGLTEGFLSSAEEQIEDKGKFDEVIDGPKCWIYPRNHGKINVSEALRDSCNYFFYEVGYRMSMANGVYSESQGISTIQKYASLFGLDETTGIEIPESAPQIANEYPITAAIGQSNNSYTTVQLSRYVTAVANEGIVYNYTLLKKVADSEGDVIKEYKPGVRNVITTVSNDNWDAIHAGMRMVVETHEQFDDFAVPVAGKTGTAQQVVTRPNHALFVGYAPYESPKISIACRIAYGYSSQNATSFAANVLKYYFHLEKTDSLIDGKAENVGETTNSFND